MSDITYERLPLRVGGVDLSVATARRAGELAPILFLHGFGSTKEDYVDSATLTVRCGRALLCAPFWHGSQASKERHGCRRGPVREEGEPLREQDVIVRVEIGGAAPGSTSLA